MTYILKDSKTRKILRVLIPGIVIISLGAELVARLGFTLGFFNQGLISPHLSLIVVILLSVFVG